MLWWLQEDWAEACRYQTVMKQLRVSISSVERRELLVEWHLDPETIGQNMAQLKRRYNLTRPHTTHPSPFTLTP